jgi:hypothetical protein
MPPLPYRDRIPYPDANVEVVCKIGPHGLLIGCAADLKDERGPALAAYVERWKVTTERVAKCSVWGRQLLVSFALRNGS